MGNNSPGYYTTSLRSVCARLEIAAGRRFRDGEAGPAAGRAHATAITTIAITPRRKNLRVPLRRAYDEILERFDLIAMPTLPSLRPKIPAEDCSRETYVDSALKTCSRIPVRSTWTGHPALTLPCGRIEGLPIGMMLVGRHFEETILLARRARLRGVGRLESVVSLRVEFGEPAPSKPRRACSGGSVNQAFQQALEFRRAAIPAAVDELGLMGIGEVVEPLVNGLAVVGNEDQNLAPIQRIDAAIGPAPARSCGRWSWSGSDG